MSLPIQPIPFREEIKTLIERIAALQKELKEKTDRLHFLYGFELRSSAAPVGNGNDNERAEHDTDDEQSEDEQEDEAKKTHVKKTAAKAKVNRTAIKKTSVKKGGSKKEPRLCKKCEENYLEDNARSNWVNCKECRDKNTEVWNEGRANRERKQKEQNAKRKKQQGDEVEADKVGDEVEEAEEGDEEDLEEDSEDEVQEARKDLRKQPKNKSGTVALEQT
ncbi:hypothetical protein J4E85_005233 [Alternaria conjuncta]|uniref:uncharacterized protein n=1 Tax=Alternaria conjuncta TaxID=181017 RepID=UPI00221FC618|nr:uncharacterized protein J4E85_005233 [Alternaria conjuncta]KAI4928616.1 hypothetical protein J4E85_005233 [Alternaria conjuncta]